MSKKFISFRGSKKVQPKHIDKSQVQSGSVGQEKDRKGKKKFVISLSIFLQSIIVSIFCLFFLIIYVLVNLQNETIAVQSNLQLQGEVSEKIQSEIENYLHNANTELSVVYNIISQSLFFGERFDVEVFLAFVYSIMDEDASIHSIYFGDVDGNFYMVQRIENKYISTLVIKNDGTKIRNFWTHRDSNAELIAKFPTYREFSIEDGYDPRKRPWYKISQENKILWTKPYFFAGEAAVLGISGSRKVIQNGVFSGVLGIDLSISYLNVFFKKLSFSQLGHILITDADKQLIAVNDKNNVGFDRVYEEYFNENNEKKKKLLSIDALKSSEEMTFFIQNIAGLSESSLIVRSKEEKNILDILLSTFFPKYSKSASLRRLLLQGLTSGSILFNKKKYIYTYSRFSPLNDDIPWNIYTFTDTLNINASSEYLTRIIIWIFSVFIILFIFIMYQSSKIISMPLIAISELMLNFKQLVLNTKFVNRSLIRVAEIENIGMIYNDVRNSFSSFKKFVPDVVIKETLKSSSGLKAVMNKKKVSVLFSDIEGFTSITERVAPEALCEGLTVYFSEMSKQVWKNNGIIDKFIGDAIMAMFGAFDDSKNSNTAQQAVHAALLMHEREALINAKLKSIISSDIHFHTRIGINTGHAMVGIIGSEVRLNFTVIGDMVNLASRLESANKHYGSSIIVSSYTKELAGEEFVFRFLDNVQVKGKEEFVMIYQLVGRRDIVPQVVQDYISEYEQLQKFFFEKNSIAAREKIEFIDKHFVDVKDALFESLKNKILLET